MSVPLGTKVVTALVGVLLVLPQTPASAQYSDSDSSLGGTNCDFLTLQQCRTTEILRAGLMLQSARGLRGAAAAHGAVNKPRVCWRFT
jgi:hypothetical protein